MAGWFGACAVRSFRPTLLGVGLFAFLLQAPASALDLESLLPSFLRSAPAEPPHLERAHRPERPRREPAAPKIVSAPELEAPPASASTVLVIAGDSLGIQLAQGLRETYQGKPETFVLNRARGDTGLVNTAVRDWPRTMREIAASGEKNSATLVMIGSNDGQPLRDETGTIQDVGSDKWRELYARRIDEMIAPISERKVALIWIGLPIPRSEKLAAHFKVMNELYKARAEKAGGGFVDVWDVFADENGHYEDTGPNIAGETVKLRAGDGVHFTKAGYRKLAFFVDRELGRVMRPDQPPPDTTIMPDELREQIRLQSDPGAAPGVLDLRSAVPVPDAAALAPELRKREAGPIVPLTALPVAPSGQLLGTGRQGSPSPPEPSLHHAAKLADETFLQGKVQYPKPNRGDDFAWPRR